jgi:2-polyprenyl-6-methoxyphenol hydroxylase-like FAD-dependent oxidoreductase
MSSCIIAGCGPAGAMLGLLLARQGVEVTVLEKHGDFLRDFRGDTIHPSTIQIMDELGLSEQLLALPHSEIREAALQTPTGRATFARFERLRIRWPFIAILPQWDFLDLVTTEAAREPSFTLRMNAEGDGLLFDDREDGRVTGLRWHDADGAHETRADLVVAADGRSSVLREAAGLVPVETSAPMDVLWFRLTRKAGDPEGLNARVDDNRVVVMIPRPDHWQAGFLIPKGHAAEVRARGIEAFRADLATTVPDLADRVGELTDWDQVKLLAVQANRLKRWWKRGFLCIGDAAHAMSPIAGVGINLAIQDAVVAGNLLGPALREGRPLEPVLASIPRRRILPTVVIQTLQGVLQRRMIAPALAGKLPGVPAPMKVALRIPGLRALPGRLVGLGVWPVHVRGGRQPSHPRPVPVGGAR